MEEFPYSVVIAGSIWVIMLVAYAIARWRERPKSMYIIPRVFVLCSPRTVQFHYELILRVGLASGDFNPDKYDIDLTVLGQQKNEVVPMTRLNTRTLLDEPLITSLSMVVYRLVEMPQLGSLVLRHSGPFKSFLYAYDFTLIDLSTNHEHYYTINQYIGSLNRVIQLDEPNKEAEVFYPIDDVPLPSYTLEDIFLINFSTINCIMLSISLLPINCNYLNDALTVLLVSLFGLCLVVFLDYLVYYRLRWSQERKEYFNQQAESAGLGQLARWLANESFLRLLLLAAACLVGGLSVYFAIARLGNLRQSLVWLLVLTNVCTLLAGLWAIWQQVELGELVVALGLRLRSTEMQVTGMRYSELVSDMHTKSGNSSDDGSSVSLASKVARSFGPRSSVKSFGFRVGSARL